MFFPCKIRGEAHPLQLLRALLSALLASPSQVRAVREGPSQLLRMLPRGSSREWFSDITRASLSFTKMLGFGTSTISLAGLLTAVIDDFIAGNTLSSARSPDECFIKAHSHGEGGMCSGDSR